MAEQKSSVLSNLLNIFKIGPVSSKTGKENLKPIDNTKPIGRRKIEVNPSNLHPKVDLLFKEWKNRKFDESVYSDRKNLYQEMDSMYFNNVFVSRAVRLYQDEIIQADSNNTIIQVEAVNKEQQKFFEQTLEDLNVDSQLDNIAFNLVLYGDAGLILSNNEYGIDELISVDPFDLEDRIEFTAHDIEKQLLKQRNVQYIQQQLTNNRKLQYLLDEIKKSQDYSSYFKSFLFGFQLGSFFIPPWKFIHIRNYTSKYPFFPYGIPTFLHALYAHKQYEMAIGLQTVARQAKFPIDLYNLNIPNSAQPLDKLNIALEFLQEYWNSGLSNTRNEQIGVGEKMITIKDLFEYQQIVPQIDLGRIDDIELLRDDLAVGIGIPRNFIDPNNGSFGNSGIGLIEQFKPFARSIFKRQSSILEGISQVLKIHAISTGKFNPNEINFKLSMPYPESQTNNEIIDSQRNLFDLANQMIDGIKERVVGGENIKIPISVIKSIYKKVLPNDPHLIDKWVDEYEAAYEQKQKENEPIEEEPSSNFGKDFTFESFERRIGSNKLQEIITEEVIKTKLNNGLDHKFNGRHYFSSRKKYEDFDYKNILKFKEKDLDRFSEKYEKDQEGELMYWLRNRRKENEQQNNNSE